MRPRAAGRWSERSVPGAARPDRRHGPPASQARLGDRLALSRGAVRRGLFRQGRTPAAADAADVGAYDPQAHAQSLRRGSLRALDREPVLSAVLRRGVLPASADLRSLVADALAPTDGRGTPCRADPGEPVGRHAHRRGQARRLFQGDRRHDRSTQGCRLSDRRQADASGARAAGQAGPEDRRRPAPVLRAGGETCADRPSALRPRQAVQARQSVAEDDPNLSRPHHARHRAQDQRRRRVGERLRPSAHARPPGARAAPASARERRSIRCTRPRSSASARARPIGLTSLASRSRLPRRSIARRADSSSPTPRRCRATPTTATPLRP